MLRLAAATPRTAAAWTSSGTSHEQRGLKHRPNGTIRMVPAPPVLTAMLRAHHAAYGTAPDGRLFRGTRGGSAQRIGLRPCLARPPAASLAASGLARRPYDLRHAALSLWLNTGGDPAQIAARAGNSVAVLLTVYSHCIHGRDNLLNQQIDQVLEPPHDLVRARPWKASGVHRPRDYTEASGHTDRATAADAVRQASVTSPPGRRRPTITPTAGHRSSPIDKRLASSKPNIRTSARYPAWPTAGPQLAHRRSANRSHGTQKPVTPSDVTGSDLRKQCGRCWVRTNVG
jgi:hypothetical protein